MSDVAGRGRVEIEPDLRGFARTLNRDLERAADRAGQNFSSRFGKGLGNLGVGIAKALGVTLAASAGVAAAGITKAVFAASDLNETISKTQQVFGTSSGQITKFADEMADKFGLPKQQILDAASNIGLVAKASGLAAPEAAKMSTELAALAADASSFFNVPLDQALEKIRAGLVGEAEPLRAFGVLLSEAAVQAEAQALGLGKASGESGKLRKAHLGVEAAQRRVAKALKEHGRNSLQYADAQGAVEKAQLAVEEAGKGANVELTEQQKVQARASIITKQMATASGDLSRTQDSLANVTRNIKGDFANLTAEFGQRLLPAAERVGVTIRDRMMPALSEAANRIADKLAPVIETRLVPAVERFADKLPAIVDNLLPQLTSLMEKLGPFIERAGDALANFNFGDISKTSIALLALKAGAATGTPQGLALGAAIAAGLGINIATEKFGGEGTGDLGRVPVVGAGQRWWERVAGGDQGEAESQRRLEEADRRQRTRMRQSSFAHGGIVPGPVGAPRLALVHGGEAVFNDDQLRALGSAVSGPAGGDVYLDGHKVGTWVSRDLQRTKAARS